MVGTQRELAVCSHSRTMEKITTAVQMLTVVGCGALLRKTTTWTINGVTVEVSKGFEIEVPEFRPNKSIEREKKMFHQSMAATTLKAKESETFI